MKYTKLDDNTAIVSTKNQTADEVVALLAQARQIVLDLEQKLIDFQNVGIVPKVSASQSANLGIE